MTDLHAFQQGGDNYLFFTRSAKLYQISHLASRMLGQYFLPQPEKALPERDSPPPRGLPAEESALYAELLALLHQEHSVSLPAPDQQPESATQNRYQSFSIYLAQTCNMACCYCWNRGGSFGKPGHLMGRGTARETTSLILALVERSCAEKICINFYGGEPLLDFPVLQQVTLDLLQHEARLGKKFCFTLDTNGTRLEGDAAQFLARHFTQVGVSLDGSRRIHDLQRPGKYGEGTWQHIVNNIRCFPAPKLLGIRATLTARSDSYLETFRHLATLEVGRIQLEYCHEPGFHRNPSYEKLIVPPDRQLAELREFVDYYVDYIGSCKNTGEIPFRSNLLDSLARLRRGNRFTRPCGAGTNTLAINSRGSVFPCIAFVEREDFAMGRVDGGSLSLHRTLEGFAVDRQLPCNACWLRYDCAGGCYATRFDMTGHPRKPHPEYCRNMKGRAEIYLYALDRILSTCPWHLEK